MSASATSASSWLRQARRPPAPSAHAVLMAVLILALALGSGGSSGSSLAAGSAAAANGPAAATMSEAAAFQLDAQKLKAQYGGNPADLREIGRTEPATGRNRATTASVL